MVTGTVVGRSRGDALVALEAAFDAIVESEALLSTWRTDTPLSRLNEAAPGVATECPGALAELLARALETSRASGGAFDPTVGALVSVWDLRGRGRVPSAAEVAAALADTGYWLLSIDAGAGRATRATAGVRIDEGAFGKGYGLELARGALARLGVDAAFLDMGGQVLAVGSGAGDGFVVEIAHPAQRTVAAGALRLRDASAATSGESERFVVVEGRRYGHILDPRSGWPVPAYGSVTVVASDPVLADMLSTMLYVLGPDEGLAFVGERRDVAVLYLLPGPDALTARFNAPMSDRLIWLDATCP